MLTKVDPWKLSLALMKRSACRIQVGAVVTDREGRVFAWGWNHAGADGLGLCAERHALGRANPKRLPGAAIHVRGFNGRHESQSKPCRLCQKALSKAGVEVVHYRDARKQRQRSTVTRLRAA